MFATPTHPARDPVDLRRTFPRRVVPAGTSTSDWPVIEGLGVVLLERACASPAELERGLEDMRELTACVLEEGARRDIANTAQTDDPSAARAYLDWVREIRPRWQGLQHRLEDAYLASPFREALPSRFRVYDRLVQNRQALYREDNLPLEVEERELGQAYEQRRAAMTITYEGQEYTLQAADRFLESPNCAIRQAVWALLTGRVLADREALDTIFDRLRALRAQMAHHAGFASYREYAFRAEARFDYGPDDCPRFHDAVEAHFVPLASRIAQERRAAMGLARLRPWDEDADPLGRPPLPAFASAADLLDRCEAVLRAVAPEFGDFVRFMREERLFDAERRRGKAALNGYSQPLWERRWPFVFLHSPPAREIQTLMQECGHAIRYILAREDPLIEYWVAPHEFREVASTTMELLAAPHLHLVYERPGEAERAYRTLLDNTIMDMPWIATVDAFQHWVYAHPDHTVEERQAGWTAVYRRFHPEWDWSGARTRWPRFGTGNRGRPSSGPRSTSWRTGLRSWPQLWRRAVDGDTDGVVAAYRSALALGGSRPLPELFEAAGLRLAFDEETMAPLATCLARTLDGMPYRATAEFDCA